jgi:hypothetical protein
VTSLFPFVCRGALATVVVVAAACGGSSAQAPVSPAVRLVVPPEKPASGFVEVTGVSAADARAFDALTTTQRSAVLRVSTSADGPAILGDYTSEHGSLRFTPAFPFDRGRTYHVRFDPALLPGRGEPMVTTVRREAPAAVASTVVTGVSPSGHVVPENLLRMYIEFSAPMGIRGGVDHLTLVDADGKKVDDPFLPLDYEFWNRDRTRFTAFLDPGRVKRDLLPNTQMGRSLRAGEQYTLIVDREWRDGAGMPLREEHRSTFRVAAADDTPIDPKGWAIESPANGARPLVVRFPEPLDRGLLMRALAVERADGAAVDGSGTVPAGEASWAFTPASPWRPGAYHLVVLSILEDLAGNRIGRPFEVDRFDTVDKVTEPDRVLVPFRIAGS